MGKIFNRSNIINGVLILLFLVLIFVPPAKALVLEGLMKIGFFRPDTAAVEKQVNAAGDLSGIKFKDVDGKLVDLGELKGKVVFLNFWATWCPPCLAEMPSVNALHEKFKNDKDVIFILVDADSQLPKAQKFMDKKGYQLPVYAVASDIPEVLFKGSLPTTVVFDKEGRISYNESGAANYADSKFIDFINKLKTTN
ncbi:thiol-disulfide isomerase/thioredoxin [Pedobacter cryoconitis]|uniref:TlpA family protein disulfide reductase n=1 Tax=Pedobacter cryoconitis TaxID=188932 RepID=UPI00161EA377|nr:TlpA disulfide reductase family protein [Pedobacter cryoconitis]MBB6273591.1 thiol-disulfide isomerase/thioredoxin [Pedobacter cryoconitis]